MLCSGQAYFNLFFCAAQTEVCPWTHHASRTQPLPVGDLWQRRVEAVDVVGRWACVATQQLSSILTHSAKLHVVILFLTCNLLLFVLLIFRLPLDSLFLLNTHDCSEVTYARCKLYDIHRLSLCYFFLWRKTQWLIETKWLCDHSDFLTNCIS